MKHLIFVTLIIFTLSSCIKDKIDCPIEFELPGQVLPYDSVYHIGDTISLVSIFSKNVTEINNHKGYNLENIKWDFSFRAFRIDSGKTSNDANKTQTHKCFNIISSSDTNWYWFYFSNGGSCLYAKNIIKNDSFNFILNISPQKKGIYIIGFGSGIYDSNQDFKGKCKNVGFNAQALNNKGKDNNIFLLKESPIPHYNDWILQKPNERFYPFSFAFRVIE